MEELFVYHPSGVCSREMKISYDGDIITNLEVIGGCNGNLKGISALVKGRKIPEVISTLKGIDCRGRGTSCPDQLSKALEALEAQRAAKIN